MNKTFYLVEKAVELATELNSDLEDNWLYSVVYTHNGKAYIEVYDENEEFVGYL